ncbi:hypothetical protein X474_08855 [Dethiosulfatarculus sandiegensis]|uniref:Uncharacterized protein n=1 Tax=Dethiosulfatarculus sandiegensis TaxID=1429043 RepID=A0A0D2J837_9BACT|nr:hypothetical protein X474_08855 [Dethiosulfatarculus sandiegensis]
MAAEREINQLTGFDTIDTVGMVSASLEALGKW